MNGSTAIEGTSCDTTRPNPEEDEPGPEGDGVTGLGVGVEDEGVSRDPDGNGVGAADGGAGARPDVGAGAALPSRSRYFSSLYTSRAVWNRSRGFFSRHLATIRLRSRGRSARTAHERNRHVAQNGRADVRGRIPAERPASGGQLVEDDAEREEIGPCVHGLAADLLRRHVGHRAQDLTHAGDRCRARADGRACGIRRRIQRDLREAEVEHLHPAVVGHHDVAGLEIAVHDAALVRGDEGVGQRDRELEHAGEGKPARGDELVQALPVDQLHREEADAVLILDGVERDDVRDG